MEHYGIDKGGELIEQSGMEEYMARASTLDEQIRALLVRWHDAGWTDYAIEKQTGMKAHQIARFRRGQQSLWFASAIKLAKFMGVNTRALNAAVEATDNISLKDIPALPVRMFHVGKIPRYVSVKGRPVEHETCTYHGCDRPHKAHGYCDMHYQAISLERRAEPSRK